MDYTYFLFALFVFAMLALLVFLNDRLKRSRTRDNKEAGEKEQRLFKLYQNLEDMIDGFEAYVEEEKAELAKDRQAVEALAETLRQPAPIPKPIPPPISAPVQEAAAQEIPVQAHAIQKEYRMTSAPVDAPSLAVLPYKTVAQMAAAAMEKQAQQEGGEAVNSTPEPQREKLKKEKPAPAEESNPPAAEKDGRQSDKNAVPLQAPEGRKKSGMVKPNNNGNNKIKKVEEVRKLKKQGLNEEEIAKRLSLSRGEVALIIGLPNM